MKRNDFESLSVDELWVFREEVAKALAAKLVAEKRMLERRLTQLIGQTQVEQIGDRPKRRPYPFLQNSATPANRPKHGQEGANSLAG